MTADTPDYLGHRKRLKERFLSDMGRSMPDYELLELLLMGYIPRKDVKPLAKKLLKSFGDLGEVLHAPVSKLINIEGIGENTAINIAVMQACWHRGNLQKLQNEKGLILSTVDAITDYLRSTMGYLAVEEFHVLYFDVHQTLLKDEVLQRGTIDNVVPYMRELVQSVLENKAKRVIIAHNHPSGNTTPSEADIKMTKTIQNVLSAIEVEMLDHIIVGKNLCYSFRDSGILRYK